MDHAERADAEIRAVTPDSKTNRRAAPNGYLLIATAITICGVGFALVRLAPVPNVVGISPRGIGLGERQGANRVPELEPPPERVPTVTRVPTEEPVVFVTIDDGWTIDPRVAAVIEAHDAPITQFVLPQAARRDPGFFESLDTTGGTFENHTLAHPRLVDFPFAEQRDELCRANREVDDMFGARPRLGRPPYGRYDDATLRAMSACGLYVNVLWSAEMRDGVLGFRDRPTLVAGDIIAMHFTDALATELEILFGELERLGLTPARLQDFIGPTADPRLTEPGGRIYQRIWPFGEFEPRFDNQLQAAGAAQAPVGARTIGASFEGS